MILICSGGGPHGATARKPAEANERDKRLGPLTANQYHLNHYHRFHLNNYPSTTADDRNDTGRTTTTMTGENAGSNLLCLMLRLLLLRLRLRRLVCVVVVSR